MPDFITIGETMAAFAPETMGALRYVSHYRIRTAGAESNTAVGVAKLGGSAGWISRLGEDEFGRYILNAVRGEGVDTRNALFDQEHPTGVMFKQTGVSETKVFYYREHSAASFLSPEDIKENSLEEAKILHLTGITPVLSPSCLETVLHAVRLAQKLGVPVSFDPNIRRKLWKNTDFIPLLRELTLGAQIALLGLNEAEALFGVRDPEKIFDILFAGGNARYAAIKNGADGCWVSDLSQRRKLPPYPAKCIDPIGAGDGFNAGFLTGLLGGKDIVTCGRMGNIAGALATQTTGDTEGYPDARQMEAALAGEGEIFR